MTGIGYEYASALFTLALEGERLEEYGRELEVLKALILENPKYIDILSSPAVLLSERLGLIDEAFGNLSEYVVSLIKLLCENGRIGLLLEVIETYFSLMTDHFGRVKCEVYYASELSNEQKARLIEKLEKMSGKKVDAVYIEDRSIIGGFKVLMNDMTLDASIETGLFKVKDVIGK